MNHFLANFLQGDRQAKNDRGTDFPVARYGKGTASRQNTGIQFLRISATCRMCQEVGRSSLNEWASRRAFKRPAECLGTRPAEFPASPSVANSRTCFGFTVARLLTAPVSHGNYNAHFRSRVSSNVGQAKKPPLRTSQCVDPRTLAIVMSRAGPSCKRGQLAPWDCP